MRDASAVWCRRLSLRGPRARLHVGDVRALPPLMLRDVQRAPYPRRGPAAPGLRRPTRRRYELPAGGDAARPQDLLPHRRGVLQDVHAAQAARAAR